MSRQYKWSVVVVHSSRDPIKLFRCLQKLSHAVDFKRTQIIISSYSNCDVGVVQLAVSRYCSNQPVEIVTSEVLNVAFLYNEGAKVAAGEYLVFVDDSVVVSNNFLLKMSFGLQNYGQKYSSDPASFVSPMTNKVFRQMNVTEANLDEIQDQLDKQPEQVKPWAFTSAFTRFCFMLKLSIWQELGGFDPEYSGHESLLTIDFSNRLLSKGHLPVFATDVLVYVDADIDNSTNKYLRYYEKQVFPSGILAILYRVKIDTQFELDIFIKSLKKSSELGGRIFVLDDNSKIKLGTYLKESHFTDLWGNIEHYEKFARAHDEKRDWNQLMDWAKLKNFNWVLCLEGDEILEDKVTSTLIQKLINPPDSRVMGYYLHHYYLWDDFDHWRMDGPWGKAFQVRLARILPNRSITGNGSLSRYCGYTPTLPGENIRTSGIRVKQFGFITSGQRREKRSFFEKMDSKKDASYEFVTSEFRVVKCSFKEESTITAFTPVKEGGIQLSEWLDHVSSFADEVVLGNDGMSEDSLKIAKDWYGVKTVSVEVKDNYAVGRNLILDQCGGKWILQLDLDERVSDLNTVRRLIDADDVDAWMTPIDNLQKDGSSLITRTIRIFKNTPGARYWGRLHETVDNAARSLGWKVSHSPVSFAHYGYLLSTPVELWAKMQRYIEINLKQIEEHPTDGRAYYNLALHFLEDNLLELAVKLLMISHALFPGNPLTAIELAKTELNVAYTWFQKSLQLYMQSGTGDDANIPHIQSVVQQLSKIVPQNYKNAPGHAVAWLLKNPVKRQWLETHIAKMEQSIEQRRPR